MKTEKNNQQDTGFTTIEEIKNIKILSADEVTNLNDVDRGLLLSDAVENLNDYTYLKYRQNKRKLIISSVMVILLFGLIVGFITLLVLKIIGF
ncbi:hypothetical protein [Mycoplasmopsis primatum]|uniref:hypothetical protein n=1 Tax=Mycoplasmopsis primatum TaxID=55604 RepID=UPI0004964CD7|nr:hypothetical protein [Mycoplasmopsis primatum]